MNDSLKDTQPVKMTRVRTVRGHCSLCLSDREHLVRGNVYSCSSCETEIVVAFFTQPHMILEHVPDPDTEWR